MDGPAIVVKTHAASATSTRFSQTNTAGWNVSSTTVEVLRVSSTTDSSVRCPRSVPADDRERLAVPRSDAFEDLDELWIDRRLLAGVSVPELVLGEVRREVAHCERSVNPSCGSWELHHDVAGCPLRRPPRPP